MGAVFTPETLEIAMVSFEGPDQYSQAGGLGVRAKEMCRAFAAMGFTTTLYFVGDPGKPHDEVVEGLRLVRVCQKVSAQHPAGVYDGEHAKIEAMWQERPRWWSPILTSILMSRLARAVVRHFRRRSPKQSTS